MKRIRLSKHAEEQCVERGTNEKEVIDAILYGNSEIVKKGRRMYHYEVEYREKWQNRFYMTK